MNEIGAIIVEFWDVLSEMAPYLLFGFLVAGLLSVLVPSRLVERHLGGDGIGPVVKASLFGIPLPLCSCGVIPVAASIRRQGASRGATTSFLLSTPQTGVDSILVTFSLLGLVFAVFRPLAALFTGLIGGWLVAVLAKGAPDDPNAPASNPASGGIEPKKQGNAVFRALRYGFVTLPEDISRSLLVGLAIAGIIAVAVPDDFFSRFLGNRAAQMGAMLVFGIPIYVCATASVPVAFALLGKGISAGAVLVFLMTGPATNAATVTTIWKLMGRRTAIIYLGTVAVCALGAGVLLDFIYAAGGAQADQHVHWEMAAAVRIPSAVILAAIVAYAILPPLKLRRSEGIEPVSGEESLRLSIEGMTCSHCAETVRGALSECSGVESVEVDVKHGTAVIGGSGLDPDSLGRAVESVGYSISGLSGERD